MLYFDEKGKELCRKSAGVSMNWFGRTRMPSSGQVMASLVLISDMGRN